MLLPVVCRDCCIVDESLAPSSSNFLVLVLGEERMVSRAEEAPVDGCKLGLGAIAVFHNPRKTGEDIRAPRPRNA